MEARCCGRVPPLSQRLRLSAPNSAAVAADRSQHGRQVDLPAQNALIVVLAQAAGSACRRSSALGIVDRLFSRVGAADELARGRSTFMVEMAETAAI